MNFYNPSKTFLELVANYKGDMDDAYNLFQDGWSDGIAAGIEKRPFNQALGIEDLNDFSKFELDEISVMDLLKKYGKSAAAASTG